MLERYIGFEPRDLFPVTINAIESAYKIAKELFLVSFGPRNTDLK